MYKLQHPENLSFLEVETEFIKRSNTLSNLLNDLDSWNSSEPIPVSLDYDNLSKLYSLYLEVKDLMCDEQKLIVILTENLDTYINKYPKCNKNPPCYDKLFELYQNLSKEEICEFIKITDFLDMSGLTRILSIIYAIYIKNMKNCDEKVEIFRTIRQRLGHIN